MRPAIPLAALLLGALPLALAANLGHHPALDVGSSEVLVVVIDSGIDPAHPEFAAGQIVAWWDFTRPGHASGVWMASADPYDPHGHGTAVASLVGGATVGAYPGVKLGVAKVMRDGSGDIHTLDLLRAMRWAVDVVGADVVTISIGAVVPEAGIASEVDEVVRDAHDAGVLVVAAAGNGVFSMSANLLTETGYPAGAPDALAVGAVGRRGSALNDDTFLWSRYSNVDPDVAAWGTDVCVARASGTTMAVPTTPCARPDGRYGLASGTSFAAPLVAGWGARVMQAALDAGQDASGERVKSLLVATANDHPLVPYAFEGRGFVNGFTTHAWYTSGGAWTGVPDTVADAITYAQTGAAPPAPAFEPAIAGAASAAFREASATLLDRSLAWVGTPRASDVPNRLEASAGSIRDAEVWTLSVTRGDRVQVWLNASQVTLYVNDADLYVFPPGTGGGWPVVYDLEEAAAVSAKKGQGPMTREHVDQLARHTGTYTLVAQAAQARPGGWSYSLQVRVNGAPVAPTFAGGETHVVAFVAGLA